MATERSTRRLRSSSILRREIASLRRRAKGRRSPRRHMLITTRGKSRPPGRGRIARTPKASFVGLVRRLLLLDVLPNNGNRCAPAASCKIAWRPQSAAPQILTDAGVVFLANHPAGYTLQTVHKRRHLRLMLIFHQQYNICFFSISLNLVV